MFRLGRIPRFNQTDNSTAATHAIGTGERRFNQEYVDILDHLGMEPRTIGVGESEQNGDVEALNGALKRRLKQHLLLRGSADFEDREAYATWLQGVLDAANALRGTRLRDELDAMRPLVASRLQAYTTEDPTVSSWSTIRVQHNSYSVPSRLIGETVQVRIYEDHLEVWYANAHQLTGEGRPYRLVVPSGAALEGGATSAVRGGARQLRSSRPGRGRGRRDVGAADRKAATLTLPG